VSLPTARIAAPAGSDWNDTIRSLEQALIVGDAEQVASIAIAVTNGPVPSSMRARAEAVIDGIGRLEDELSRQLEAIAAELDRIPSRPRWANPPAPSQLDCSA
jgi:hypothetical protein